MIGVWSQLPNEYNLLYYLSLEALVYLSDLLHVYPRSGELRMQKLKSHLVRTQGLNILP